MMATTTLDALIKRMKAEILSDMRSGTLPVSVCSFSDLHDYVNANCYGGSVVEDVERDIALLNEAQNAVGAWLKRSTLSNTKRSSGLSLTAGLFDEASEFESKDTL